MSTDSDELAHGTLISERYRIVRKLGAGGMGAVYEAVQEGLGRRVALKVLLPAYAQDPEAVARFQREAQAAASLGHPNIVTVTDFGASAGQVFLVMEFLAGASLAQVIERERTLSASRAAWIATQVLSALSVAHHAGIVHRDMKPDNVFLTEVSGVRDVVKVLDFGIARFTELHGNSSKLTSTGAVLGTPAYMSPEQARGRPVDARSDLYSVGVMLYEMLTGRLPFQATNYHALLFAILEESPPSIATLRGDVAPALIAVVERAMSRDINTRFQSADELRAALGAFAQQPTAASVDAYARTSEMQQVALVSANTIAAVTPAPYTRPITPAQSQAPSPPQPTPSPFAMHPAQTPSPSMPVAQPSRAQWLPLAGAAAIAIVASGMGLALSKRGTRRRVALETPQITQPFVNTIATNAQLQPHVNPVVQATPLNDPATNADAATSQTDGPPVSRIRGRQRGHAANSVQPPTLVNPYSADEQRTGLARHRPVRTTLAGGIFNGASRAEIGFQLQPLMPRINVCANIGRVRVGEGAEDHWGMEYDVSLDTSTGRVIMVQPHGDTTSEKPGVVMCMRALLRGFVLVPNGSAPSSITLSFTNTYIR